MSASIEKDLLLTQIEEIKIPKEKKASKDLYQICSLRIPPYWKVQDEEDEGESNRGDLTWKNHSALGIGLLAGFGLGAYYYQDPSNMTGVGLASGTLDIVKVWSSYVQDPKVKRGAQVFAITLFALGILFPLLVSEKDKEEDWFKILKALPFVYPFMGLLKEEISRLKLSEKIIDMGKKYQIEISEDVADLIAASVQLIPALGLVAWNGNPILTAAASIFAKGSIRVGTNKIGQKIYAMESGWGKKIAITAFVSLAALASGFGIVGNSLGYFSSRIGRVCDLALVLPGIDMATRTGKGTIKNAVKDAKKLEKKEPATTCQESLQRVARKVAILFAFSLPIIAIAIFIGQTDKNSKNAAVMASVFSDAAAFIKIATKGFDEKWVIALSSAGVAGGAAVYGVKQWTPSHFEIPGSRSFEALAALLSAFVIYHLKRAVRPKNKVVELENG